MFYLLDCESSRNDGQYEKKSRSSTTAAAAAVERLPVAIRQVVPSISVAAGAVADVNVAISLVSRQASWPRSIGEQRVVIAEPSPPASRLISDAEEAEASAILTDSQMSLVSGDVHPRIAVDVKSVAELSPPVLRLISGAVEKEASAMVAHSQMSLVSGDVHSRIAFDVKNVPELSPEISSAVTVDFSRKRAVSTCGSPKTCSKKDKRDDSAWCVGDIVAKQQATIAIHSRPLPPAEVLEEVIELSDSTMSDDPIGELVDSFRRLSTGRQRGRLPSGRWDVFELDPVALKNAVGKLTSAGRVDEEFVRRFQFPILRKDLRTLNEDRIAVELLSGELLM